MAGSCNQGGTIGTLCHTARQRRLVQPLATTVGQMQAKCPHGYPTEGELQATLEPTAQWAFQANQMTPPWPSQDICGNEDLSLQAPPASTGMSNGAGTTSSTLPAFTMNISTSTSGTAGK